METRITATELARSLSDILSRVRYRGEKFLIERNGEPIATLGPAVPAAGITMRELAALLRDIGPPDEGFADDLEAIRSPRSQLMAQVRGLNLTTQLQLLEEMVALIRHHITAQPRRSILELRGLGKEIWEGIDPQEYVEQERAAWNG